jgi:hypothetical protein
METMSTESWVDVTKEQGIPLLQPVEFSATLEEKTTIRLDSHDPQSSRTSTAARTAEQSR